jgi:uncharacterized protein (TIGR03000 family)
MFRKALSIGSMLFLAGAVLLGSAGMADAQPRGWRSSGSWYGRSGSYFGGGYYGGGYYGRGWSWGSGYYPYYGYYPYGYYGYRPYPYGYTRNYADDRGYRSYYPTSDVIADEDASMTAHVTVNLPSDATLWFNGAQMRSTGPTRQFDTPPLTGGKRFTYEARAQWNEGGRQVTQTQEVVVSPGANVSITFPMRAQAQ